MNRHRRGLACATLIRTAMAVALGLGLAGLSACTAAVDPEADWCVPVLAVSPDTASPGGTIVVTANDDCPRAAPDEGWTVVAAPVGDLDAGVRVTTTEPSGEGFRVELTLPEDFPAGESFVTIENWDYSACDDTGASCAAASAAFTVTRTP